MAHIGLEIIYNNINKPFWVQFHHIGALFFVFRLFNKNVKYKGNPCFPDLKIYQISFIILSGLAIANHIYFGPAPFKCSDAILRCD